LERRGIGVVNITRFTPEKFSKQDPNSRGDAMCFFVVVWEQSNDGHGAVAIPSKDTQRVRCIQTLPSVVLISGE
jgi:hypothetical protein